MNQCVDGSANGCVCGHGHCRFSIHALLDWPLTMAVLEQVWNAFINGSTLIVIDVPRLTTFMWPFLSMFCTTVVLTCDASVREQRLVQYKGLARPIAHDLVMDTQSSLLTVRSVGHDVYGHRSLVCASIA